MGFCIVVFFLEIFENQIVNIESMNHLYNSIVIVVENHEMWE